VHRSIISRLFLLITLGAAVTLAGGVASAQEAAPAATPAGAPAAAPTAGKIIVKVTNLQNIGQGQLLALLYKKVNRVEVNGVKYYRRQILPVKTKKMSITFENVPFGEYAVAIMHDMDKNKEMDTNFIGIPDEDLGVSNNVKGGPLGGPKWAAAKFSHKSAENTITPIEIWQCYD